MDQHSVSILGINEEGFGRCSGVLLKKENNKAYILTAKHCIEVEEEMYVENNPVELIIESPSDDLAYLIVRGELKNKEPIKLAWRMALPGDTVYHLGYPNWDIYDSSGEIIRITNDWEVARFRSTGGCSGGGVFNENMELIGILWGGLPFESTSIYEPMKDIRRFLITVNKYIKI